ncbi:MAG: GntR family transcriptional regulator [Albidovulum sp.]|nr:GntR family transcriptional regulator [Albidovulum sp.]MDE0530243.1 GntR family transcriptional regulator [Albidovulum sp.]
MALAPRYSILAEELRRRIRDGEFKPGDKLPSEAQLCSAYGLSRGTVVKALEKLVADGVVHRRQGVGRFVARPSLHRQSGKLQSFTQSASAEGLTSKQELIAFGQASRDRARQFQCDEPAVFLERVRAVEGAPCAVHRSIIPLAVARRVPALTETGSAIRNHPNFSLYEALDQAGFRVVEATERVTSRLASSEEADHLNVAETAPVMVVFRLSYDATGRLAEAVEAIYLSEYYSYDMRLVATPIEVTAAAERNVRSLGGRLVGQ